MRKKCCPFMAFSLCKCAAQEVHTLASSDLGDRNCLRKRCSHYPDQVGQCLGSTGPRLNVSRSNSQSSIHQGNFSFFFFFFFLLEPTGLGSRLFWCVLLLFAFGVFTPL